MALILPKGIVVNSPEATLSIERINAEPLDLADIAKFWKGTSVKPFVPRTGFILMFWQFIPLRNEDSSTPPLNVWRTTGGAYGEVGAGS